MPLTGTELVDRAEAFVRSPPHQALPYSKRNWGGGLHSLCSYRGKLKPSIAHFLVDRFTSPGDRVLDPMSGVGTIPLEARIQGRIGLAGDLSPLAAIVSRAKLQPVSHSEIEGVFDSLSAAVYSGEDIPMSAPTFGLNGPIESYFHPRTMNELLHSRAYFLQRMGAGELTSAEAVVLTAILHILHGNRPYALSRRSHPLTPYSPSGEFVYKSVIGAVRRRLDVIAPLLVGLAESSMAGRAIQADFRESSQHFGHVDAVITSPPFADSFRFWSTNWMRLWFAGWEPEDFSVQPRKFLESEQKKSYEPYRDFASSMAGVLKPDGVLILHLGETASESMAQNIMPLLADHFAVFSVGRESVEGAETHGVRDASATKAHWYLFARRR